MTLPDAGSTPAASTNSLPRATLTICLFLFFAFLATATEETLARILWRGQSHPVGTIGGNEFAVADAARALGFSVSRDLTTGVLTLSGYGHRVLIGPGTVQVPVDEKVEQISRPAREVSGRLHAPADFFEKVLFPMAGATGSYDPSKQVWTLSEESRPPVSIEVTVVHVEPTTQVVLRQSAPARFSPSLSETGFEVRWPGRRLHAPFSERRYPDRFVAAVRFAGDTAKIEFREAGLAARAYPLTNPDRLVVEVGRAALPTTPVEPVRPAPAASRLTIVVDPGHGGGETGAIGPDGLEEKEVTLEIARRLAASIPRVLHARTVLTRESDSAIPLDDRTAAANHEKADLFLSLHANSSHAPGAHGSETYFLSLEASDKLAQEVASRENQANGTSPQPGQSPSGNPELDFILWDLAQSAHLKESSEIAEAIQEELNLVSGTENRGIKQAPFRVLVGAAMPAVLIEVAFISNPEEEKKLRSPLFQQSVADSIAKAMGRYWARREPSRVRTSETPSPTTTPAP